MLLFVGTQTELTKSKDRRFVGIARCSARMRGAFIREFADWLGRKPTADDLLREVAPVVPVPPWLTEVIREDLEVFQG